MPTFRELLHFAELSKDDTTSGKRIREIEKILRKHEAFKDLTPDKAVAILEDLGPTFVKIGQIASNRGDVIPADFCDAFQELRTHVSPLPFSVIIDTIERSYRKSWNEVFSVITETPIGSASIAQVHKAVLRDGTIVAVKVRRPGIAETMAEDITLLKHILAFAEISSVRHESIVFSLDNLVTELEKTTADELDFTVELGNLVRFYNNLSSQADVTSPRPYPAFSNDEILVMEFETGVLLSDKQALAQASVDLSAIGKRLVQSYVTQVLDDGFFHADPHPGNVLVKDDTLVWIDLGMTGSLSASQRASIGTIFKAVVAQDAYELKEALLALTDQKGDVDHGLLLEQMASMLASYTSVDLSEINIGSAFVDVIEILRTQNLSLPSSFTTLARGLVTLEGVVSDISPDISVVDMVSQQVTRQLRDPHYLKEKAKSVLLASARSAEAAARIPTQVSNTLEMMDRGELKLNADMKVAPEILASLYAVSGRIALAMISAGLFIGASVLCTTELQPELLGVPLIGFFGFIAASVLGIYTVWLTLRSRHKQVNNETVD